MAAPTALTGFAVEGALELIRVAALVASAGPALTDGVGIRREAEELGTAAPASEDKGEDRGGGGGVEAAAAWIPQGGEHREQQGKANEHLAAQHFEEERRETLRVATALAPRTILPLLALAEFWLGGCSRDRGGDGCDSHGRCKKDRYTSYATAAAADKDDDDSWAPSYLPGNLFVPTATEYMYGNNDHGLSSFCDDGYADSRAGLWGGRSAGANYTGGRDGGGPTVSLALRALRDLEELIASAIEQSRRIEELKQARRRVRERDGIEGKVLEMRVLGEGGREGGRGGEYLVCSRIISTRKFGVLVLA